MRHQATTHRGTLRSYPTDRLADAIARYRTGGRRWRNGRRAAAIGLILAAGLVAVTGRLPAAEGTPVWVAARDLAPGTELTRADVRTSTAPDAPSGALAGAVGEAAVGRVVAGPVRRGEILTDVRLLSDTGPDPGPGRSAVLLRSIDPMLVGLLSPGTRLAVLGVDPTGAARTLTDDAFVLWLPPGDELAGPVIGAGGSGGSGGTILLSVPDHTAELVATTELTGTVAVRFTSH